MSASKKKIRKKSSVFLFPHAYWPENQILWPFPPAGIWSMCDAAGGAVGVCEWE